MPGNVKVLFIKRVKPEGQDSLDREEERSIPLGKVEFELQQDFQAEKWESRKMTSLLHLQTDPPLLHLSTRALSSLLLKLDEQPMLPCFCRRQTPPLGPGAHSLSPAQERCSHCCPH